MVQCLNSLDKAGYFLGRCVALGGCSEDHPPLYSKWARGETNPFITRLTLSLGDLLAMVIHHLIG